MDRLDVACEHRTLYFGSGAFYVFCKDCNECWVATNLATGETPDYRPHRAHGGSNSWVNVRVDKA